MTPIKPFSKRQVPKNCFQRNKFWKNISKATSAEHISEPVQFRSHILSWMQAKVQFFHIENPSISKKTLHFCAFWLYPSFQITIAKKYFDRTFWILNSDVGINFCSSQNHSCALSTQEKVAYFSPNPRFPKFERQFRFMVKY